MEKSFFDFPVGKKGERRTEQLKESGDGLRGLFQPKSDQRSEPDLGLLGRLYHQRGARLGKEGAAEICLSLCCSQSNFLAGAGKREKIQSHSHVKFKVSFSNVLTFPGSLGVPRTGMP